MIDAATLEGLRQGPIQLFLAEEREPGRDEKINEDHFQLEHEMLAIVMYSIYIGTDINSSEENV